MKSKLKVLFICMYNMRNPMAVGFLSDIAQNKVDILSAWVESDELNPIVQEAMEEVGIGLSSIDNCTKPYFDINPNEEFNYVVTICDDRSLDKCPIFPNASKRLYWNMENPKDLEGAKDDKLRAIRKIRDKIRQKVETLAAEILN
jgi:arsenate reductase (thioredoxin)